MCERIRELVSNGTGPHNENFHNGKIWRAFLDVDMIGGKYDRFEVLHLQFTLSIIQNGPMSLV